MIQIAPKLENLNAAQSQLRSNIRNAWFCMTFPEMKKELAYRLDNNDFFGASVLVELMSDYADDQ